MNEGNKYDDNKAPITKLLRQFPNALKYISYISQYGHNKYGTESDGEEWDNWKKVENRIHRYEQALGRHLLEPSMGLDDESGFLSIGHTGWNALAVLESILLDNPRLLEEINDLANMNKNKEDE